MCPTEPLQIYANPHPATIGVDLDGATESVSNCTSRLANRRLPMQGDHLKSAPATALPIIYPQVRHAMTFT